MEQWNAAALHPVIHHTLRGECHYYHHHPWCPLGCHIDIVPMCIYCHVMVLAADIWEAYFKKGEEPFWIRWHIFLVQNPHFQQWPTRCLWGDWGNILHIFVLNICSWDVCPQHLLWYSWLIPKAENKAMLPPSRLRPMTGFLFGDFKMAM